MRLTVPWSGDIAHQKKRWFEFSIRPPLRVIRGADDPDQGPDNEMEIRQAVSGSQYLRRNNAGHFPFAEKRQEVNRAIDEFLAS
jgi:pimeloyl-ACP methyl ester carboxylesterase